MSKKSVEGIKHRVATIVVDCQNDFMPGGKLAVKDGSEVVEPINLLISNKYLTDAKRTQRLHDVPIKYELVVYSLDWHPEGHISFEQWGEHCVMFTPGACLHKDLYIWHNPVTIEEPAFVYKGYEKDHDDYSAFRGMIPWGNRVMTLNELLKEHKIDRTIICGLALDVCVRETALDSYREGYETFIYPAGTRAVNQDKQAIDGQMLFLMKSGVKILESPH